MFDLQGIAPAPRGVPQIEVTFDIDANGILHVGAKDLGTGKEQKITISGGSSLSKEEIERMVKDAEAHADEDKARREEAETRNIGDSLVYQTEKFIKDNEEKLSQGDAAAKKSEVESALTDLKSALAGTDVSAIKSATEKVSTLSQEMGAALYAANPEAADGAETTHDANSNVEDAEIVEEA
jgi:molecular chaperone DnaK